MALPKLSLASCGDAHFSAVVGRKASRMCGGSGVSVGWMANGRLGDAMPSALWRLWCLLNTRRLMGAREAINEIELKDISTR